MSFAIALALVPQTASAHAQLLQSDPRPDSLLDSAPASITLVFSEPVTPAGAGVRVFDPSGRQVAGAVNARASVMVAPINSTVMGTYVVSWQVLAADTHPSRGAFRFVVGRPSANPYAALLDVPEAGTATPVGLALQALARWVHFAGFALVFGVVAYKVRTRQTWRPDRLVGAGVLLLIAAEPLALLGQLASLSFDGDTALAVLASSFGRIAGLRLGGALLLWALLGTRRSWPLLGIGGAIALLDGASAHAIPDAPGAAQLVVAIHVAGMGLWVGGLAGFLRAPSNAFGRYAAIAAAVAVVSGLALGLVHTQLGLALFTTGYGRLLLLKVAIVGAALTAAALRRHRPEFALALVAVASATLLAALPPPT